ncbi:MAG: hypothetical protein EBZ48_14370 [Proteobacteria bacterium]|nr:hypothetical protein [Pseudomonadota bacterium]
MSEKLLRDIIRQILYERFDRPPQSAEERKKFWSLLGYDIASGASSGASDQSKSQHTDASEIKKAIDLNKNEIFDEEEIPDEKRWKDISDKLRSLYGPRLMSLGQLSPRDRKARDKERSDAKKNMERILASLKSNTAV